MTEQQEQQVIATYIRGAIAGLPEAQRVLVEQAVECVREIGKTPEGAMAIGLVGAEMAAEQE